MKLCSETKANGEACKAPAVSSHGYCWAHSPENAEQRSRQASRAAKAKKNTEVKILKEEIKSLISRIDKGALDPSRGNSMIRAYSVLLDYIKLERGIFVEEDLAERVEELQRASNRAS